MEKKSRTRRQAQVEEFAHTRVKEFSAEQQLFLQYSDELSRNVIQDPEHIPEEYSDQLKRAIQNYWESYVQFLRHLRDEDREALQAAERNAKLYESTFSGPVMKLKSRIKREGEQIAGFLGKGSNGAAYTIEVGGKEYVVKFGRVTQTNFEIRALMRAKGVPHAAQIIAYSFEDGAQVMERLPGKDVTQSSEQELSTLTDQQITELVQTIQQLARRGVVIDPKPSNFMYDQDEGFGVLDYHTAHIGSSGMGEQVMSLRSALSTKQGSYYWPAGDDPDREAKMKKHATEQQRFYLPRLIRFITILQEQFPEVIQLWKWHRKSMLADPRRSGGQFLRKDYFEMGNPDISGYVAQLEEMDDGWMFI